MARLWDVLGKAGISVAILLSQKNMPAPIWRPAVGPAPASIVIMAGAPPPMGAPAPHPQYGYGQPPPGYAGGPPPGMRVENQYFYEEKFGGRRLDWGKVEQLFDF